MRSNTTRAIAGTLASVFALSWIGCSRTETTAAARIASAGNLISAQIYDNLDAAEALSIVENERMSDSDRYICLARWVSLSKTRSSFTQNLIEIASKSDSSMVLIGIVEGLEAKVELLTEEDRKSIQSTFREKLDLMQPSAFKKWKEFCGRRLRLDTSQEVAAKKAQYLEFLESLEH